MEKELVMRSELKYKIAFNEIWAAINTAKIIGYVAYIVAISGIILTTVYLRALLHTAPGMALLVLGKAYLMLDIVLGILIGIALGLAFYATKAYLMLRKINARNVYLLKVLKGFPKDKIFTTIEKVEI
jgi:hypothetical protein